jgi:spore germination cell wall hydrolase CwlJ-like protein
MLIYGEARGEPLLGQQAVAAVVMNRVASRSYPDDVCAVVTEPGQFSFAWQPPREAAAWRRAVAVAEMALAGDGIDPTGGALYYNEAASRATWSRGMTGRRIGDHIFWTETP